MLNVMKPYGSLDNYISALRREAGFLQDELAILMGLGGRSAVSRYESAEEMPDLAKLIALEIIFDEPIQKIFAGIAEDVRENIPNRARAIMEGMGEKATAA